MSGLGDSNGINQDAFGQLLAAMQNNNWSGMLLPGFPGTGKTEFANALGNEAGGLFIQMDLGGTKGSLVGQSEKMIRNAIQMLLAMGGEDVMFVGTCNSMAGLRPELKRRFGHGTFFFDLPTKEEVRPIWDIYREKFNLDFDQPLPECSGWTGAEVRKCSQLAWELDIPLIKAANFITPVAKIMGDEADKLRKSAHMRYLSASYDGLYKCSPSKDDVIRMISKSN
jgi:SpoVK/Ycf46/Vps4 family AAA+-type ATPase